MSVEAHRGGFTPRTDVSPCSKQKAKPPMLFSARINNSVDNTRAQANNSATVTPTPAASLLFRGSVTARISETTLASLPEVRNSRGFNGNSQSLNVNEHANRLNVMA